MSRKLFEFLDLKKDTANNRLIVYSDTNSTKETFYNKDALTKAGFIWDRNINSWYIKLDDMQKAVDALNNINNTIASKAKSSTGNKKTIIAGLEHFQNWLANQDVPQTKKNELEAKLEQYIQDIANATDDRAAMAELQRFFEFMSKFHKYSFTNSLLIYLQKQDATRVAGFRQWKEKFHRNVKQGAKAIYIFRPETYSRTVTQTDDTDGEKDVDTAVTQNKEIKGIRFVSQPVFDVSDTEPIDERGNVPETPKWKGEYDDNEAAKQIFDIAIKSMSKQGINITNNPAFNGEGGYSTGGHVNVSSDAQGTGAASTVIHEWAHELLHHKNSLMRDEKIDKMLQNGMISYNELKQLRELQAETVSAVVSKYFDLSTEHHPTYLALWKVSGKQIKENITTIKKVSNYIIEQIETND